MRPDRLKPSTFAFVLGGIASVSIGWAMVSQNDQALKAEIRLSNRVDDRPIVRDSYERRVRKELRNLKTSDTPKRSGTSVRFNKNNIQRTKWTKRRPQDRQLHGAAATEKRVTKKWINRRADINAEKEQWVRRIPTRNQHSRYDTKKATKQRQTQFGAEREVETESYENKVLERAERMAEKRATGRKAEIRQKRRGRDKKDSIKREKHIARIREHMTLFEDVDNETREAKMGSARIISPERRMAIRMYQRRKNRQARQASSSSACASCENDSETE